MNPRRLYRCRHDRQLAGVAAGMAEYLGVDPTLVRVLWVVSIFFGGVTFLLYIILAFVMPLEPADGPVGIPGAPIGAPGAPFGPAGRTFGPSDDPALATDSALATDTAGATDPSLATDPASAGAQGSTAPGAWPAHRHEHVHGRLSSDRRGGRVGLVLGVVLVVLGAMALAHSLFPGTAFAAAVGPAFLLVLGVALVVTAARRTADAR